MEDGWLRAVYALALRLHVLPEQIFSMPEYDFVHLLAACKLEADEQERAWRKPR
jgi:hypothetical protein